MTPLLNNSILEEERTLKLCREALGSKHIFAACFYGPKIYGYTDEEANINTLLILPTYSPKIHNFTRQMNGVNLSILAIDQKVFESDLKKGQFGEFASEIIAFPYQPWINQGYLEEMEVKMKKRFVLDLLRNIVLQYPELSIELLINPEYFMYEVTRRRARFFPPLMYHFIKVFEGKARRRNIDRIMKGYLKALKELEAENYVTSSNGYITINNDFVEATKRDRTRFSHVLTSIQKALFPHVQSLSSRIASAIAQGQELLKQSSNQTIDRKLLKQLEETERYLYVPTPLGPVPLSDKTSIQDFVRKTVPGGEKLEIKIEEIGGVLNSVFLLRLQKDHETQKIVVKKFEDWLGFKWFPLALWTLGTQSFAVLGKTRLEREYSSNQFLSKHGLNVPRILYVSLKERLIFEDFVEGEKLSETVKQIVGSSTEEDKLSACKTIRAVGKEIARTHLLGVALGDCKPENILVTNDGSVCLLDLEQATRNGNQPWDVAEFLYYSGHYIPPIHSDEPARMIASSFIEGYLEAGGKRKTIRKAASAKYTKVFSIFTLPHIILTMANICRKAGRENNE